jgi:hypothetical protein
VDQWVIASGEREILHSAIDEERFLALELETARRGRQSEI